MDADALDDAPGAWPLGQGRMDAEGESPGRAPRTAVAVDGKTLRGSRTALHQAVHLVAAAVHGGAVIAQRQVATKSNEITAFRPLLASLDPARAVLTFDALHTQADHARFLVKEKNAHFIAVVKANHPTLQAVLKRRHCAGTRSSAWADPPLPGHPPSRSRCRRPWPT
ncbi:ISAs1 family transposase [Streptomyces asiaticus]|uniref:ISAs1 family transposase n=1 Tax=Streptomyces asiaticus TaxID=114695 RepID=UPI0031CF4B69